MTAAATVRSPRGGASPRLRRQGSAALAGLLAAAAALVTGELLGRLLPGGASPVLSVADRVIDLTPDGPRRAAISAFGTADKPLLLIGVLVGCALLGAAGGLLAARRPSWTAALVVAGAVLAAAAQLAEPDVSPAGALVTAAGLALAAAGVLRLLLPRPAPPVLEVDGGKRLLLLRTAGVLGAVAVGSTLLRHLASSERVTALRAAVGLPVPARRAAGDLVAADLGVPGVSPVLTPNLSFYRIDTALVVPQVDPTTWSLRIDGRVDRPYELTYDELLAMPHVEADVTLQCVSNEVGGGLVGTARWQGVLLRDVLERAGVSRGAQQVLGRSVDGFTAGFPLEKAFDDSPTMIAVGMNGEPLPLSHGFPARLVVPGLYGYVSATKWLSAITLTRRDVDGYWIARGWSKDGPIKTASRVEVPRDLSLLDAGAVVVAGTAWAPGRKRGIVGVEVRVDGGGWQQAELGGALSENTWRQWRWRWQAPAGDHLIEVRATDRLGNVQTGRRAPVAPDGATGYHGVRVRVLPA